MHYWKLVICICLFFYGCCTSEAGNIPEYSTTIAAEKPYPFVGIIYGDTRGKHDLEIWRSSADPERSKIPAQMVQEKPEFIINTGDIVLKGSSHSDWEEFDTYRTKILENKIPYFPCLGNHDYWGRDSKALDNYFSRFPDLLAQHWYKFQYQNILFCLLDTNWDELKHYQQNAQKRWLEKELKAAQESPNIRLVIVAGHYPPYTNSKTHDGDEGMQKQIVPLLMKYPKVRLLFSGHCHSYEHFYFKPIHYVVSGGGGAPLFDVITNPAKQRYADLYVGEERRFHYCRLTFYEDRVHISVQMMNSQYNWYEADKFTVEYPTAAQ